MIKSIVILGGGTSGWLAACYLNRVLSSPDGDAPIAITVVESEDIGIIGVGEATVPSIKNILNSLGIPEWQFLAETDATFKHGILFRDWLESPGVPTQFGEYFHMFENPPAIEGFGLATHWAALCDRGATPRRFGDAVSLQTALCHGSKSPKPYNAKPYEAPLPYAYHLDAVRFGQFLRKIAVERGVRHVIDTVGQVKRHEDGSIAALVTQAHGDIAGDFFIDCSGFSSVLLGGALEEPFQDWGDYLLCDRAVACQIAHERDDVPLRPYTTASAKEAGWLWEIDLFSRRGNGYVYSSRHTTPERAEDVLRQHLGPLAEKASVRQLRMQIGHRRNMWSKNCLALGLAAGFLEPLESTGIYLLEVGLSLFTDHVSSGPASPYLAARFNRKMGQIYEELRDFIQLHYITSNRDDSAFWRDYTSSVKVSDALKYRLDLWTFKLPSLTDLDEKTSLFGPSSYTFILAGMDRMPAMGNHLSAYISPAASARALQAMEQFQENALQAAPDHREYVQKQRAVAR